MVAKIAILALETGETFQGIHIGVEGVAVGEIVFNTAMVGYQEILSDPSYAQQIITLTYPHIGNTGVNDNDNEHTEVFAKGLVVRDIVNTPSNWRCNGLLSEFLIKHNIIGISDIDTRALTRIIRTKGSLKCAILSAAKVDKQLIDLAIQKACEFAGLENTDLAKVVSTKEKYNFKQGSYEIFKDSFKDTNCKYKVAVYDYGVKKNILRLLVDAGCELTVFPAQTPVAEVLAIKPDGVFLSNGPGDPQPCDYAIKNIKELLALDIPLFGICLGHQLLALASGAKSEKMKFGHHGANHPVQDLLSKKVMITSQNHGFTIANDSINANIEVTHRSLFDDSIQGIKVVNKKAFSFQGHPEASPGPHDMEYLFNNFKELMA